MKKLSSKINDLNMSITINIDYYDGKYMKAKFNLDDELPLNKIIEIPSMIIGIRAIFHENNKHYPQVFLNECLYKLRIIWKYNTMIELTFLKELILISDSGVIFVSTGIF